MVSNDSVPIRYRAGDQVLVRDAYPIGHVRTPRYVRGKCGVVERCCGAFRNPEELAYARAGTPRQPLYRVRFLQRDLWPDYAGSPADTVDVEIYQHWLHKDNGGPT